MLKSFDELYALDISNRLGKMKLRNGADLPYLSWGDCTKLLHENGAKSVYFTPIMNTDGSYLFVSREVTGSDGKTGGCYFVKVEGHIDDLTFEIAYPLIRGSTVIKDDTLDQADIARAHARAFVKGVAIHTGLGFSLWTGDEEEKPADDLSSHSAKAIRKRIYEKITAKIQEGYSKDEVLEAIDLPEEKFKEYMDFLKEGVDAIEKALAEMPRK